MLHCAGVYTNVPREIDCHCEEQSDEAIQLDRHGALRAPRDDKSLKLKGHWYYLAAGAAASFGASFTPVTSISKISAAPGGMPW